MADTTYYLDNGVIIRNEKLTCLFIDFPNAKRQIELVRWDILANYGNDIYFITEEKLPTEQRSIYKASFSEISYIVEPFRDCLFDRILNIPYYLVKDGKGYIVRSFTSDESWKPKNFGQHDLDKSKSCFVYRQSVALQSLALTRYDDNEENKFPAWEIREDWDDDYEYDAPWNEVSAFHFFNGFLYAMVLSNYTEGEFLIIVDIANLEIRKINVNSLHLKRSDKDTLRIRNISSTGVMYIQCCSDTNTETVEYNVASCQHNPGANNNNAEPINQPNNADQQRGNIEINDQAINDQIAELMRKNGDQATRIEELERKYKHLLMMLGRSINAQEKASFHALD